MEERCLTDRLPPRQSARRLVVVLAAATAIALAVYAFRELELASALNRPAVEALITRMGAWAPWGFLGLFVLVVLFSLPSSVMTVVGGALFGFWGGLALNLVGATVGAIAGFWAARRWGRDRLERRLHPRLLSLNTQMAESGFFCLFFLRFAGVFPFAAVNYTAGLSRIRFRDFVAGTVAGMGPGMAVYTYLGASLTEIRPGPIALGFAGLAALSLIGWWWQRQRKAANCLPAVTFLPEAPPPADATSPRRGEERRSGEALL